MFDIGTLKSALERSVAVFSARPEAARVSEKTVVRGAGHEYEVSDGPWRFKVDVPEVFGGKNTAAGPNTLGRAALGFCMTHSIVMTFAMQDVPLRSIEVEVESLTDLQGPFHLSADEPPGFKDIKYTVKVDTDASPEQIEQLVAAAETVSPWFYNMTHGFTISREIVRTS